ncbi:acyl-CoA desaturase [Microvirga sp. 2TAF3]|uniref:acyl-CoA desaturase n=1 Tax=Microvirga sp. 2TAF3 TaxID=3233014 RepID=UPI003F9C43B5
MSSTSPLKQQQHDDHHDHDDIVYPQTIPFILVHLACFAAIWTSVTWEAVTIAASLYWLRMFGITAGYHRYFSHRSYATSRVFQFILACLAQSSAQKSVLWWAAKHRHHHLFSDTEHDVHSPRHTGFLFAHAGWIFARKHDTVDLVKVGDFTRYPELMWLHRYELVPAAVLAVITFLIAGWPGLVVGFFWSTVAVYHATFCINSLAHVRGSKRYVTGDDSRNNWLLAFFTMGEGWHNNHHAYQASVRQGFRWWEIDPTFYILKALSWVGVVWDLKSPPEAVLKNEQKLGSRVIDRAAADLVATFNVESITAKVSHALETTPSLTDLRVKLTAAQHKAHEVLAHVHLPHVPTRDEIWARASTMFVKTRSLDDIVERAHRLILEAVGTRLVVAAG